MPDNILFQKDRLTVSDSNLTIGRATVFYSSISVLAIYEVRPLLASAILSSIGFLPLGFIVFTGPRLFGPIFSLKPLLILFVPLAAYVVFGFCYRVKCLFVTIDGQAVAVLKSKEPGVLEQAKAMIEQAKTATESKGR